MGLIENAIISLTKFKLRKALNMGDVKEVSSEGLIEYRDVSYNNRSGKELLMDIFEPIVEKGTELPVIVNIHGGGNGLTCIRIPNNKASKAFVECVSILTLWQGNTSVKINRFLTELVTRKSPGSFRTSTINSNLSNNKGTLLYMAFCYVVRITIKSKLQNAAWILLFSEHLQSCRFLFLLLSPCVW